MENLRQEDEDSSPNVSQVQEDLDRVCSRVAWLEGELAQWRAHAEQLELQLGIVLSSRSWKITAPLRFAYESSAKLKQWHAAESTSVFRPIKDLCRRLFLAAVRRTRSHPKALALTKKMVGLFPKLDARIRSIIEQHDWLTLIGAEAAKHGETAVPPVRGSGIDLLSDSRDERVSPHRHDPRSQIGAVGPAGIDWTAYPPSVRKIYEDLKNAIDNQRSRSSQRETG